MILRFNSNSLCCHLVVLVLAIVLIEPNVAHCKKSKHNQEERALSNIADDELLIDELIDLDGESNLRLVSRRPTRGRDPRDSLVACPKQAAAKRAGITQFAYMKLHKAGSDYEHKIEESKNGEWVKRDVDRFVSASGFDVKKPTVVYTHGWIQNNRFYWMESLRDTFDKSALSGSHNLLIFDWSAYNFLVYGKSVSHVPHLARLVANFFEQLSDRHHFNMSSLDLVSFSLSTHIFGIAARQLAKRGKIHQLTVLDPTGVCFHEDVSRAYDARYGLRASDAPIVVAKHYNMGYFGAGHLIGGLDIIINDGKSQPLMVPRQTWPGLWTGWDTTSHLRANSHDVAPFKLNSDCHEMAYACTSYEAFKAGECGDCGRNNELCYLFSTFGNLQLKTKTSQYKPGTVMYITTGFNKYCVHYYQVIAQLIKDAPLSAIDSFGRGQFVFEIDSSLPSVKPNHRVGSQRKFTQLLQPGKKIESFPSEIIVRNQASRNLLNSLQYVEVKFLSHVSRKVRQAGSIKYCPMSSNRLEKCPEDSRDKTRSKTQVLRGESPKPAKADPPPVR